MLAFSSLVFANKKVLITGGSSGIGKQLAADFLRLGARVAILADNPAKLESAHLELSAISSSISSFVCDVAELDQVKRTAASYTGKFGAPDILVSNAGFAVYRAFDQMPVEEIARLINVNLTGGCLIIKEFLSSMLANGSGNIVVVASIAGKLLITPCGVYGAAKHGLVALARSLHLELSHTAVKVHVICPGRVETDFFADESFKTRTPRKEMKFTVPIEAVSRAIFKAIEQKRFMTYIPKTYALLVWFVNAFPFPAETLLNRLMQSRLKTLRTDS